MSILMQERKKIMFVGSKYYWIYNQSFI